MTGDGTTGVFIFFLILIYIYIFILENMFIYIYNIFLKYTLRYISKMISYICGFLSFFEKSKP